MNIDPQNAKRAGSSGFTLMEILLAFAVSAIVLSVITTVYFGALRLRNRTMASYDDALPLQHTLIVLKRDVAGILPPGGTLSGELKSTSSDDSTSSMNVVAGGRQVGPVLYTASGTLDEYTPFADVRKVSYYLASPTNSLSPGWDLIRVSSGNLLPSTVDEPTSRWLMSGIESMYFQYYDGSTWANTWDSETSGDAPIAIKIQIAPATADNEPNDHLQEPVEIIVPVVMQSQADPADEEETGS